jgi:3'-phosphoadenosine 5'-phosphosulfate sulfotransferase (PAPS reductase)/FAD synthetase
MSTDKQKSQGRKVVVGFSGGVTSAWCAGWALRQYPRDEIVLLWHDTKEEHPDTYRFLREMAAALGLPITERSDGRSVTQVFRDEGFLWQRPERVA